MSKPEFIFVPGAWHHPDSFAPTTAALSKLGYAVHGVVLPGCGAKPPKKNFDTDIEAVKSTLNKVLSSGTDVVMLYHSSGGVFGSEALNDYLNGSAQKEGWGKVRRLVYISAFALPVGGSVLGACGGAPLPWFIVSDDGEEVRPDNPAEVFYNDLAPDVAQKYVDVLQHQSYLCFSSQLTVEPWKIIPSTYIVCEKDAAIPAAAQEGMIQQAQQAAPTAFDVVEKCDASHSPFLSQPEWLAEKLAKAAA